MAKIDHILCPVDFSDTSSFALTYANLVARDLGARITALNVYQLMSHVYPDDVLVDAVDVELKLRGHAENKLEEVVAECKHAEVSVSCLVREGVASVEIASAAQELGVDMVVMGTHGRTGMGHLLLGSVAERVVRHCKAPVLTVRKPS